MWIKKYQIPFESFTGTQYMVYIYERGDTQGSVTQLTGAADPFTTQEDANDDIFTPIRKQTGYLRVLDETGTLLEPLIPANNTEKLVRLYSGTWNSAMTTFTDGTIQWQGFLCAQAYTQPWDNSAKVIEFPVKSVLAAMEDVSLPDTAGIKEENIAMYITRAYQALDMTLVDHPDRVYFVTDLDSLIDTIREKVSSQVFHNRRKGNYDDPDVVWMESMQMDEVLSQIMSFYGLMLREKGNNIYICKYDQLNGGEINVDYYTWANFLSIAVSASTRYPSTSDLQSASITDVATFIGADNVEGFVQGAKLAKVDITIAERELDVITEMHYEDPGSSALTEQIDVNRYQSQDTVYVRLNNAATPSSSYETYQYQKYVRTKVESGGSYYYNFEFDTGSNFTACWQNSVIQYAQPPETDNVANIYTGAFPCRWFFQQNGAEINYRNGLFIVQNSVWNNVDNIDEIKSIYTIQSSQSVSLSNCYLNIRMEMQRFYIYQRPLVGAFLCFPLQNTKYSLRCKLKYDTQYWNGMVWTSVDSTFFIEFNGKDIAYPTDIPGIDAPGWFVPITSSMSGTIEFTIMNLISHSNYGTDQFARLAYDAIIQTLEIGAAYPTDPTSSTRTNNTYQRLINSGLGFSGEKVVNLTIGTDNNNNPSPTFMLDMDDQLLETIAYNENHDGTPVSVQQRPEVNLLARMVQQYGTVRRTLKGILQSGLDLLTTKYTYKSKNFFGVSASRNWRDDEEEVKFIEVT